MNIKIDLKIFIFIIFFYFTKQINIYWILMCFAYIHELGHLVTGLLLGLRVRTICLMPFGVSIAFKIKNISSIHIKKIIIAFAGPLTNIIIAFITYFLKIDNNIKATIIYSNILICIFNLIPIYPLDGGRILKSILHKKYGFTKSKIISNKISNILVILLTMFSSVLLYYTNNFAVLFIIFYLWVIVITENKKLKILIQYF